MRNARSIRNEKIRKDVGEIVDSAKSGTILFTDDISRALSMRKRSVTNKNVGNALSERDDVVMREGYGGVWVKQ